jgi:cytochrome c oxidase subunit II
LNDFLRRILMLPEQASTVARDVDTLHYVVIVTTMTGAAGVTLAAAWFVIRYRSTETPRPRRRQRTLRAEIGLISGIFLLFLTFWVVGFRQYVRLETPPAGVLDVYVIAKQWMWKFSHPEGQDELSVLTVPANRPVRLIMTSRDVIHSFYVPEFRIKQDVVPGRYTAVWFEAVKPGRYEVFCAELCGASHSLMRAEVIALGADDYAKWMARTAGEQGPSLARQGELTASEKQCLSCHTTDGRRHLAPTWRGLYGSWVTLTDGRRVFADEAYLTRSMMSPAEDVVAGFRPVMPTYAGRLSSAEVAAMLEFMKAIREPPDPSVVAAPPLYPEPSSSKER